MKTHDDELDSLERELRQVLPRLDAIHPAADFNDRLHQRWMRRQARGGDWRRWATAAVIALVAAAALVVLMATPPRQIAWADVAAAVERVPQFHVIAFIDDPRDADDDQKLMRMDLYYAHGDRWRAHGMGHVQFGVGKQRKLYSVEKRRFLDGDEHRIELIPGGFADQLPRRGLMGAILSSMFNGDPPVGEPVKSDVAAEQAGIAVFDYARDASQYWARIWVLRESRLPIRLQVYYPGSDETVLVNFDYTDPQPDGFFDVDAFEQAAEALDSSDAHRVYAIGTELVAGSRPRGSTQIHEAKGGYHQPTIKRIRANERGDIELVTNNPTNRSPQGGHLEEGYRHVHDNWGNRYVEAGGWTPCCGEDVDKVRYYVPLPPFVKGDGPRTLTLTYTIEQPGRGPASSFDPITVEAPEMRPTDKAWKLDAGQRSGAIRNALRRTGTLEQQLAVIEQALAVEPDAIPENIWLVDLLREHGREAQAWALFEEKVRDRIMPTPKVSGYHDLTLLAQYMLHLVATGRRDEVASIVRRLEAYRTWALNDADENTKRNAGYLFDPGPHNLLMQVMRLDDWLTQVERGVEVTNVLRDAHGNVVVQMQAPPQPAGWQWMGQSGTSYDNGRRTFLVDSGWFWDAMPRGDGWTRKARMIDKDSGEFWVALRGAGDTVTLGGTVTLIRDNRGSGHDGNAVTRDWSVTADVPAEPNADNLEQWWHKQTAGRNAETWYHDAPTPAPAAPSAPPAPVAVWQREAETLRNAGDYDRARERYERIAAADESQWPEHYKLSQNEALNLLDRERWSAKMDALRMVIEAGRLDEVEAALTAITDILPPLDVRDRQSVGRHAALVHTWVALGHAYLDRGNADATRRLVDRLAAMRPDMNQVPDHPIEITFANGTGRTMWWPRGEFANPWRAYDSLWWDLRDATAQPGGE